MGFQVLMNLRYIVFRWTDCTVVCFNYKFEYRKTCKKSSQNVEVEETLT